MITISDATTVEDREELATFLLKSFHDIADAPVPMPEWDFAYRPIALLARKGPEVIGGLLSCYSYMAATALRMKPGHSPLSDRFRRLAPIHAELDLVAVSPEARGMGLGTQLIREAENQLADLGVRYWFGCVTTHVDVDALRNYYASLGFTVMDPGQRLPPFKGVEWVGPNHPETAFWFHKHPARE